jgi:hypothetical protein
MSYEIFDAILDSNDQSKKKLLPLGLILYRKCCEMFTESWKESTRYYCRYLLDTTNAYHQEEQDNKTFSEARKEEILLRSIAVSLGPMCILDQNGHHPNSEIMRNSLKFWKYFLSARQLHDDGFDWYEDYQHGIVTTATYPLFTITQKKKLTKSEMQKIFDTEIAPTIAKEITDRIKKARNAIYRVHIFKDYRWFDTLLTKLENPMKELLKKHSPSK